jgi:hypothetical protein
MQTKLIKTIESERENEGGEEEKYTPSTSIK